jgi:hypothetical protein
MCLSLLFLLSVTQPGQMSFDPRWLCGPRSRGVCLYRFSFKSIKGGYPPDIQPNLLSCSVSIRIFGTYRRSFNRPGSLTSQTARHIRTGIGRADCVGSLTCGKAAAFPRASLPIRRDSAETQKESRRSAGRRPADRAAEPATNHCTLWLRVALPKKLVTSSGSSQRDG